MARGQQKIQAQQKNAEKQAKKKKLAGASKAEHEKTAAKALTYVCSQCKSMMPDPKTYKQHFENKHPKAVLPKECEGI